VRGAAISPRAAISLGSNISPERHLPQAVARLEQVGRILAVSQAYGSAAVGPPGQPDFVNAAVLIEMDRSPEELRRLLRRIEADLGRVRVEDKFAPRPIDLDLALYGDLVEQTAELTLADPDLLVRPYLAATVAELDPDAVHPVTHERLADIAARLGTSGLTPRPDIELRGAG
jgi:2-amino-4-hydroxy-6-hydroxymethyldihydropteridine diphosphokinase